MDSSDEEEHMQIFADFSEANDSYGLGADKLEKNRSNKLECTSSAVAHSKPPLPHPIAEKKPLSETDSDDSEIDIGVSLQVKYACMIQTHKNAQFLFKEASFFVLRNV